MILLFLSLLPFFYLPLHFNVPDCVKLIAYGIVFFFVFKV